jgi:hypothetical protein
VGFRDLKCEVAGRPDVKWTTATLAGMRIIQPPQRAKALFRDDTYAVIWNSGGYHVERIKDGQKMSGTAERDLAALYPQKPEADRLSFEGISELLFEAPSAQI